MKINKPGELDTTDTHTPTPEVPRRTSLVRNLRRPWAPREHSPERTKRKTNRTSFPGSRRPHPQRTLHKDRKGGGLFLFTHLTVERCPFLFIYSFPGSPRQMPPFSGHAILCKQGRWGRGAVPLTYVSLGSVSSVGGKAEDKNIQ